MRDEYINKKLEEVEKKISKEEKSNSIIKLLTQLSGIFTGVLGGIVTLGGIPSGITFVILSALFFYVRNTSDKTAKKIIKKLNSEKKHLEKLKNMELDGREELNVKRKKKIKQLQKERKKITKTNRKHTVEALVCGAATMLGVNILPAVAMPIITGVFSIGAGLIFTKILKNNQDKAQLSVRIANLVNDVNVINIDSINKKTREQKIKANENIRDNRGRRNSNSRVKPAIKNPKTQPSPSVISKEQEEYLDRYIESLENDLPKSNLKQKVKR